MTKPIKFKALTSKKKKKKPVVKKLTPKQRYKSKEIDAQLPPDILEMVGYLPNDVKVLIGNCKLKSIVAGQQHKLLKLESNEGIKYEVKITDNTVNNKKKLHIIIKQGKKEIFNTNI